MVRLDTDMCTRRNLDSLLDKAVEVELHSPLIDEFNSYGIRLFAFGSPRCAPMRDTGRFWGSV